VQPAGRRRSHRSLHRPGGPPDGHVLEDSTPAGAAQVNRHRSTTPPLRRSFSTRSPSLLLATRRGSPPPIVLLISGAAASLPLRKMPRRFSAVLVDQSLRRREPSGVSGSQIVASPTTLVRPPANPAAPGSKEFRSRSAAVEANP